jgi:alanine racemase
MHQTSHIRIDLEAVAGNLRAIAGAVGPRTGICAVVKADAYGLGAQRLAQTLTRAGAEKLAVFSLGQAADIESASSGVPILLLMPVRELPTDPSIARLLATGRLELVVVDTHQVDALASVRLGRPLPVHIEIDCGMGRGGVTPDQADALLDHVLSRRSLDLRGVYTHFSTGAPATVAAQAAVFDATLERLNGRLGPRVRIHSTSSGGILSSPEQRRDFVRVGLGWTGWLPDDEGLSAISQASALGLRPAVTWRSNVVQVKALEAGATVGYGSKWSAAKPTRVGLVPVGYSDGYPAHLVDTQDPHRVLVEGPSGVRSVPVLGAVSMDQIVIDLGELDPSDSLLGCEVVLLSDQPDSNVGLHSIARRAGIPAHAVLTSLASSIPRVYLADSLGGASTVRVRDAGACSKVSVGRALA